MRRLISLLLLALVFTSTSADARGRGRKGPYLGDKNREELIHVLQDHHDAAYRSEAAHQLGVWGMHKGDKESLEALMDAYKGDAEAKVRLSAAAALIARQEPDAFDPMLMALADERTEKDMRSHIAYAIHNFQDSRAIAVLMKLLEGKEYRFEAIHSLGELKAKDAVEPICDILIHHVTHEGSAGEDFLDHASEIAEGVRALGAIGEVKGLRGVLPIVGQDDPYRRKEALAAVAAIANAPGTPRIIRKELAMPLFLGYIDPANEKKADVRQQAVFSLSEMKDKRVVPALQGTFLKDPSYRVRSAAADALTRMGKPCLDEKGRAGSCNVFKDIEKRIQDGTWDSADRE